MPNDSQTVGTTERRRRIFTAEDKLRILEDTDRARGSGGISAILRREGLYTRSLTDWRRLRAAGLLGPAASAPTVCDSEPDLLSVLTAEIALLREDRARLEPRLARAEKIIDAQRKMLLRPGPE